LEVPFFLLFSFDDDVTLYHTLVLFLVIIFSFYALIWHGR
jgi:hypothetical protein